MDIISLASIIISGITAIGVIIHQVHLKNCSCFCVKSDCYKSPPPTPTCRADRIEVNSSAL